MLNADLLKDTSTYIDGKWVVARPCRINGLYGLIQRIKDAWKVFIGEVDAVKFYKQ